MAKRARDGLRGCGWSYEGRHARRILSVGYGSRALMDGKTSTCLSAKGKRVSQSSHLATTVSLLDAQANNKLPDSLDVTLRERK